MKKIILLTLVAAFFSGCASLGKPATPEEGVLLVKVSIKNPDSMPMETAFKINFNDGTKSLEIFPQKRTYLFKRNFLPSTSVSSFQTFNTHGWIGSDTSRQPYFVPLQMAPGQIGIFRDKLELVFMKGENRNSYTYRYMWVPLTNQERANIVREMESNPDFSNWKWAPSAVEGLKSR